MSKKRSLTYNTFSVIWVAIGCFWKAQSDCWQNMDNTRRGVGKVLPKDYAGAYSSDIMRRNPMAP